ncbi:MULTISPECIES: M23 family metallopeptidase [Pedobacter]|uniref:Peptidase family M23 n=1 Tax=Pedobacter suwonensis TaxID=332999 RepID=A0A1I0TTA6_9SPHI|nr:MULTISPECIES: M23 family metallopeptidase [Pedobacter]SFA54940.1 Peptidase family M23 [Pedobacter suwonensis]
MFISANGYGAIQDTVSSKNCYATLPLKVFKLNSGFGFRLHPVTGEKKSFHKGIDIAAKNEIVCSVLDGQVVKVGYTPIMGNFVTVKYGNYTVYYAHLSKLYCVVNQNLYTGFPIGLSGSTGRTTGEHLHLTVQHKGLPINPLYFLADILFRNDNELEQYLNL